MLNPRMRTYHQRVGAIALLFSVTCLHQRAHADAIFGSGNLAIQGITGSGELDQPYATLQTTGNTTTGLVTFTLSTDANNASAPIDAVFNDISFNSNLKAGKDFTLLSGPTGSALSSGGNVSQFGQFEYAVGGNGAGARSELFTFVLKLNNKSEAIASIFEVPNTSGVYFAAHMYTSLDHGVTGFIASNNPNGQPVNTPEPSTMAVFLAGLASFGVRAVRKHRQRSVDAA